MKKLIYTTLAMFMALFTHQTVQAQCTPVNCSASLPAYGGICDTMLMDGTVGVAYSDFESFHTTNNCFDAGLIDPAQAGTNIKITDIYSFSYTGLPAGLSATQNAASYASPSNGCISVSGTPTEIGVFEPTANFLADIFVTTASCFNILPQNGRNASYGLDLIIKPDPSFTISGSTFSACDPAATLTITGTTGGTFSGPGVSGTSFDPSIAGAGTHTITYIVSAQQGAAIAPAADTSTITVTVTNFSLTNTSNNATCTGNNGSATVTPTGGVSPYTYSWSSGGNAATETGLAAGTYTVTVLDNTGCANVETVTVGSTSISITGTTSTVDAGCGLSDGSATATPSNGTGPYTYAWSPGGQTTATANNIAAGNYTVVVTDANGCTGTLSATVNNPSQPTANISGSTDVACNGGTSGSATVAATGGTAPYNFNWSSGGSGATETGLAAGVYNVTVVDAASCVGTASVTISEPTALSSSVSATTDASCNGLSDGEATVAASGGTAPYAYSWSSGGNTATETGLAAGTYTITITDDNACINFESVTISEPTALSANASGTDITCNGLTDGEVTVAVTGGTAPYNYSWDNGGNTATINGLAVGSYAVTVTDDNGCTISTTSVNVAEPTALTATITATEPSSAGSFDGSVDLTPSGGTPPYSYNWNNGAAIQDLSGVPAGTYSVTISDANGCSYIDSITVADGPSAVSYSKTGATVSIFPNPTQGQTSLTIESPTTIDAQIQITNVMGQVLYNQPVYQVMNERIELNMSSWAAGVYFVRMQIGEELLLQRIVRQ